jgi:2-amino-4-hydroxy-6-hydroxymethyldihydropteridine diphosphokinase
MSAAPEPVVIGLGGNVGTQAQIIERFRIARDALAVLGEPGRPRSAALYVTAPVGPPQPDYLNTAVLLQIGDASPLELLATLHELERLLGRERSREVRWGARPIDLDLLVWGTRVVRSPELELPHPRLAARRFALEPLVDLLGEDFEIPGQGRAGLLLQGLREDQQVAPLTSRW